MTLYSPLTEADLQRAMVKVYTQARYNSAASIVLTPATFKSMIHTLYETDNDLEPPPESMQIQGKKYYPPPWFQTHYKKWACHIAIVVSPGVSGGILTAKATSVYYPSYHAYQGRKVGSIRFPDLVYLLKKGYVALITVVTAGVTTTYEIHRKEN